MTVTSMKQYQRFNRSKEDGEDSQKQEKKAQPNDNAQIQQQQPENGQVLYDFEYYQSGDLVFAMYEDYFWPSRVVKPLNNYTLYEVLPFQYKHTIQFLLDMLLDYNLENRQKCIDAFNNGARSKKMKDKFQLAMKSADKHHRRLLKKEKDKKNEEVMAKHLQIEKLIQQEEAKGRQKLDQRKMNENIQIMRKDSIEIQVNLSNPPVKLSKSPIIQAQSSENIILKAIAENKKRQETITKSNILSNEANVEFNIFRKQKEKLKQVSQMFIKPHRHNQQINEEDKSMVMYLSRYQYFFSEIDRHLETLRNVEEPVRVKICQNAIDKIVKALTEPQDSKFKICCFLPLLRIIFSSYANPFISIDKIVNSNILARILLLIKSYEILPVQAYKQEYDLFTSYCREVKQHYLIGDQCGIQVKMKIDELYKKFRFF